MITVASELRRLNQTPGRCISCDGPLPPTRHGKHPGGAKRSALCGDADCLRVYHQLYRSVRRELVQMALELRGAATAIKRANRRMR